MGKLPRLVVLVAVATLLAFGPCVRDASAATTRPKVCLVLSGGGARGMAHIGVLKVLEELRVPVDCIAGTSMGAIVGGLYAGGMSAAQIETMMRSVDWQDAFRDSPPRRELAFRRKQDDRNFLVRLPLGLKHGDFLLPKGLVQGQKLQATLRENTLEYQDAASFDDLPTPFRAVATDLESGAMVVLDRGDLALAMRASMSAPGLFAPVELRGRLLGDGGLAENLPIDIGRAMGADVLIVVDVTFPLQRRDQLTSPLALSDQMLAILMRRNGEAQKATRRASDILIEPALAQMASTDFSAVGLSIRLGEDAAHQVGAALAALQLSPADYDTYAAHRHAPPPAAPIVRFVRADPGSRPYEKTVLTALQPVLDKPLDRAALDRLIAELYGLGDFETIDYAVIEEGSGDTARTGVEVRARRKSWGPNYLRFGVNLQDDFQGDSRYNVATRFLVTEINELGAEWRTDLQFGTNPRAISEFYQPLSAGRRWFVAPSGRVEARDLPVYRNDTQIADFREREAEADLDVGRDLGDWGEIRTGLHRISGATHLRYGDPRLVDAQFNKGEYFLRFSFDHLDNVDFPREGSTMTLQWDADRGNLGADFAADRVSADWLKALSSGRNTLLLWGSAGLTLDGNTNPTHIQDFFPLGGFFNLSGLAQQSLHGPDYAIARAIYLRKIGRGGSGFFEFPAYLGVSFEAGNTWLNRSQFGRGALRKDASLFLGLDTPLGPLYLGSGYDLAGFSAFYLFLGRTF